MYRYKKVLSLTILFLLLSTTFAKDVQQLNSVTVTAQKIEEKEQDVPISMKVLNEFEIEDKGIESIDDLSGLTPNFFIFNVGDMGFLAPTIRGLSADPASMSTTVSLYVDGVPTFNTVAYDSTLKNIERIEILKGPQGTLYGKNAEAGVINVVSKQPNSEPSANINVKMANHNKQNYTFFANGEIVENKLYASILGSYMKKDGFMKNTYLDKDFNYREHKYAKLNLLYTPNDSLSFSLISSIFKRDDGAPSINTYPSAGDNRNVQSDIKPYLKSSTFANALKIKYTADSYTLESTSTYKKDKEKRLCDKDYSSVRFYHIRVDEPFTTISQEFKLSKTEDKYSWLVGVYGDKVKKTGGGVIESDDPNYAGEINNDMDDSSLGLFTQASYNLSEDSSIIFGLRYDKDTKKFSNDTISLKNSYNELSPKLTFKSHLSRDFMYYATVSKGYKSGGYYKYAPSNDKLFYDKETLWNYEVGFKSSYFDNKMVLNGSIYYMDIDNMQVFTNVDRFHAYISNAAKASSKGVELDLAYKILTSLQINASFGYNITKFDTFKDDDGSDYSGNYNLFAPKYTYAIGAKYRSNIGIYAGINLRCNGDMYADKANKYKQDAFSIVDAKIGYETESFDIYLYGKNIFDKTYDYEGYFDEQYLSDPREYGIEFAYRF